MMLGVDVSASSKASQIRLWSSSTSLCQCRRASLPCPERKGLKLRVNLNDYTLLDFDKAQAIYKRGYDTAMAMMGLYQGPM